MQDSIGFEDSKRFGKRHAEMEAPPFARVPHPVDIETIRPHTVDPGEERIELVAAILWLPPCPILRAKPRRGGCFSNALSSRPK
jgi:hypothetical protein